MKYYALLLLTWAGVVVGAPIISTSASCFVYSSTHPDISAITSGAEECRASHSAVDASASVSFVLNETPNAVEAVWSGETRGSWADYVDENEDWTYIESSSSVDVQADLDFSTYGELRPGVVRVTGSGYINNQYNSLTYFEVISPVAPFTCNAVGTFIGENMPCSYQAPFTNLDQPFQVEAPVTLGTSLPVKIKAGTSAYGSTEDSSNWFLFGGFNGLLRVEFFEQDGFTPALMMPMNGQDPPSSDDASTPEPSTLFLGGLGLLAIMEARRHRCG
jgi:hypothetical protein